MPTKAERQAIKEQREKEKCEQQLLKEAQKAAKQKEKEAKEAALRLEKEAKEIARRRKQEEREVEAKKKQDEKERRKSEVDARKAKISEAAKLKEESKRLAEEKLQKQKDKQMRLSKKFESYFYTVPKKNQNCVGDFVLKPGMCVCPISRRPFLTDAESTHLKECLQNQNAGLADLSSQLGGRVRSKYRSSDPTLAKRRCDETTCGDVSIHRAKYLAFYDSYRPPYYGTWRKKSKVLNGRRPFVRDTVTVFKTVKEEHSTEKPIDYDFDSDEEWWQEANNAGGSESSDSSRDSIESEPNEAGDSNENDGFFVEHGHLSDDEGADSDNDLNGMSAEDRCRRMKAKADVWRNERLGKKWIPLKPYLVGPYFHLGLTSLAEFPSPLRRFKIIKVRCKNGTPILSGGYEQFMTNAAPNSH